MATYTVCDICENKNYKVIKVEVRNGEHPHNGSIMYKQIDVCNDCIFRVPDLNSPVEFEDGPGALKKLKYDDE